MRIKINIPRATSDEIERGLAAAMATFDRVGCTPDRAADARFAVESWDIRGFKGRIRVADLDLCGVWDEADRAARDACCEGWNQDRKPLSADLELVP